MIDTKMIRIGMWWADDNPNPERAAATIHELCDELDATREELASMTTDRDWMVDCHNAAIGKLHDERSKCTCKGKK